MIYECDLSEYEALLSITFTLWQHLPCKVNNFFPSFWSKNQHLPLKFYPQRDPRAIRECVHQLARVFTDIFNISLKQATVPSCYNSTTIVPVPTTEDTICSVHLKQLPGNQSSRVGNICLHLHLCIYEVSTKMCPESTASATCEMQHCTICRWHNRLHLWCKGLNSVYCTRWGEYRCLFPSWLSYIEASWRVFTPAASPPAVAASGADMCEANPNSEEDTTESGEDGRKDHLVLPVYLRTESGTPNTHSIANVTALWKQQLPTLWTINNTIHKMWIWNICPNNICF